MNFNAFNIVSIPRLKSAVANLLATSATTLVPDNNRCYTELLFRSVVPYNITNLRVFDDDPHILEFMENEENFKGTLIDEEEHQANLQSGNFIPRGVRTLEGMFDLNKKFRRPTNVKTHRSSMQFELVNLGLEAEPKYVNLRK